MHRARVLRLVDENVVDALVELVMHPGADIAPRQEPGCADDQILEIELRAPFLQLLVVRVETNGEGES